MNLVVKSYVIVSLLVLTNNFITLLASDVTNEQEINIAKVFTNFMKVPWINLNTSWTDAVGSTCKNDMSIIFESADAGEMWALQMLDATSKVPSGILIGNIRDLGMYDECITVTSNGNPANIQGRHCMVTLSIARKFFKDPWEMMRMHRRSVYNPSRNVDFSLSLSVCVPSSCSIQDIDGLVNASIGKMPELGAFEIGIAEVAFSDSGLPTELTQGSILTLLFVATVAIFLLSCTVCDFVLRARSDKGSIALKNAAKFSLYTNAIKLISTKVESDAMPALNGFRVINTYLVLAGHRFLSTSFKPAVNLLDIHMFMQSVSATFVFTLFFVNDTFFVICGFLTAYTFLKRLRSGAKLNVLVIYLHRYLRLTPCYAVVVLFTVFIYPYLIFGPNGNKVFQYSVVPCQKYWWANLLYVHNIIGAESICLPHSWFLSAEMQLFWLTPMIIYPLFYWPKLGLGILCLILIPASVFVPTIQIVLNRWSSVFAMHESIHELGHEFLVFYVITYYRALPYLVGIILGYDIVYNKRQVSKRQVIINWVLASLSVVFCGWIVHHTQPHGITYDVVWEAAYVSVGRLAWSLAMAWVIYACTQGYGGPITNFLSSPVFVPFSRLCYGVYLVHITVQVTPNVTQRTAEFLSHFNVVYQIWGDVVLSTVLAFILVLCAESPMIALEKILISRRTTPVSIKHSPSTEEARFTAKVNEYLDSLEGPANSNFGIKTITSRLDFWQAISHELNIISEGPSRTPAEWLKMWRDWQSKLLKINSSNTVRRLTGTRDEELNLQSRSIALEKELMVFLAAVDCTSSAKSATTMSESESNFRNRQSKVPSRLSIDDPDSFDNIKSDIPGVESEHVGMQSKRLKADYKQA